MGPVPSRPRPQISSGQGLGLGGIQQSPKAPHWDYSQPGAHTGIWLPLMALAEPRSLVAQTQTELLMLSFLLAPHVTSDQAPATLNTKRCPIPRGWLIHCCTQSSEHYI